MSKRVTNSQFGMFEFCHILGFGHPYKQVEATTQIRAVVRGQDGPLYQATGRPGKTGRPVLTGRDLD